MGKAAISNLNMSVQVKSNDMFRTCVSEIVDNDDEEEESTDSGLEYLCPHCFKCITRVYESVPIEQSDIASEQVPPQEGMSLEDKYHYLRSQVERLNEMLAQLKPQLHEVAVAHATAVSEFTGERPPTSARSAGGYVRRPDLEFC